MPKPQPVQAQAGDASDLIAEVNAYRAANDLAAYGINSTLMSLAQAQSDYQASIGTCTHSRPDGSGPGDHGISAENVACGADLSVDGAIFDQWADSVHSATLLGPLTGLVGAGVAVASGNVYYTLDVILLTGDFAYRPPKQTSSGSNVLAQAVTATPNDQPGLPSAVITSTTNPDGSVVHIIQYGETLIQIAQAYGVTLSQIFANNPDLDPQNPKYYSGETLIIFPPFTSTPNYSPTVTPRTPTVTSKPTHTFAPTRTPAPVLTSTKFVATPTPTQTFLERLDINDRKVGYSIIAVSVVGLLAVAFWGFLKK